MRALRVEIEGTDGAGKTTGLKYLVKKLQSNGQRVLKTREVGSPLIPACQKLRSLALSPEYNMPGAAMELIFSAMRILNQDFYKKIESEYDFIVSDRGWLSHLAYADHNVDETFTKKLYLDLMANMSELPDAIVYFKVNADTALKRRMKHGTGINAIEMKGVEFQEKVRNSFLKYIDAFQEKVDIFVVNANHDISEVQKQLDAIANILSATVNTKKLL